MGVDRRSFIKYASLAAAGNAAGLRPFGTLNAMAQTATDYKALVCIFLYGGNDSNNMLIQFDTSGYANYSTVRGPLALPQSSLVQLGMAPNFALNGNMPEIGKLFDSKAAALVANVGTLVQPTTRALFQAGNTLPSNLFSHTDQQLEWQNASQSSVAPTGWAGRIADTINVSYNANAKIPMITSVFGDTVFCNGTKTTPVSVSTGNVFSAQCSEGTTVCASQLASAQALLSFSSGLSLVQADNGIMTNAYGYAKTLTDAVASVSALQTVFPATGLGAQLKQIAQIYPGAGGFGGIAADLFCRGRELRYAPGPVKPAGAAAGANFTGDERLL